VLQLGTNRGLAQAFQRGLRYAIERGADIVVIPTPTTSTAARISPNWFSRSCSTRPTW
jgi:GT2 family glycosyltransferase